MCILIVMGDCIVRSSFQRLGPKQKVMPKQLLLGGEFWMNTWAVIKTWPSFRFGSIGDEELPSFFCDSNNPFYTLED